jgi:hypothetical protein
VPLPGDPNVVDPRLASVFGDDLAAAVLAWQQEFDAHVVLQRALDGGYTRARVASVVVDFVDGPVHKYVLKGIPAGDRGLREGDAHGKAVSSGPAEFAQRHIVGQPYPPQISPDGGAVLFQEIAGGDLSTFRPLAGLYDSGELPSVVARITRLLLEEWAPDPTIETMTARDCVRTQLGRRGGPGDALDRWGSAIGKGATSPWLRFEADGVALPNPLVWLSETPDGEPQLLVHRGRAHGDLHLDNIFIRISPLVEADSFELIDLSEFDDRAPLCRDIPHLLLATIGRHLAGMPTRRRRLLAGRVLDAATGTPTGPGTLAGQGLERLTDKLLCAGDDWASSQAMLDDWRAQQLLGVIAAALIQASVSVHQPEIRWWFFELAATALARVRGAPAKSGDDGVALVGPAAGQKADVAAVAEILDDLLVGFSGRKSTVLVVSEGGLGDAAIVSRQPWDLIVEFDPATDETGAYSNRPADREHRLVTFAQEAAFGPNTTAWLAANGIDGGQVGPDDLRMWRRECLPGVNDAVATFAVTTSRPVVICAAGPLGGKARAVIESLLDAFTTRAELVAVTAGDTSSLDEYCPQVLVAEPVDVLSALPDRTAPDEAAREMTVL